MSNFTQKAFCLPQRLFQFPYLQRNLLKMDSKARSIEVLRSYSQEDVRNPPVPPRNILHLHERGIFQDIFPPASVNLPKRFEKKQCFYCGFDPTADSLHVGNLLSIMALLHCQRAGTSYKKLLLSSFNGF